MIDLRAALILLGSAGCGATAAALRLASGASWPDALLTAGAATAAAVGLLNMVIAKSGSSDGQ